MTITCQSCNRTLSPDANFCAHCGVKVEHDATCNMCGYSCMLGCADHPTHGLGGLINQRVSGGYESTPGNGSGALDDCTAYTFSLCEFCLDWLFSRFMIPTTIVNNLDSEHETFRSAAERVASDEWRKMKHEFTVEHDRRAAARRR